MNTPHGIVIAGDGTAGWMAANLFAHHLADANVHIQLIESPDSGNIKVGGRSR